MDGYQEVRLYDNHAERERVDNMAELYAVLNALENLEKVFSRDYIAPNEYTAECAKLLAQYKVTIRLLQGLSVEDFVKKYKLNCPVALERIREDRPVTVKNDRGNLVKIIADIVALFITAMDTIKLGMLSADALFPTVSDLYNAMNEMSSLPDNFESKKTVKTWHDKLASMSANDNIEEDEGRQMHFELERAYTAFNNYLHNT